MSKGGRPTKYTEEIGAEICRLIACGYSLVKALEGMKKGDFGDATPSYDTVMLWLREDNRGSFLNNYAQARELQGDWDADHIRDLAFEIEECHTDEEAKPKERAGKMFMWSASKRNAKKYGNVTKLEHTGEGGKPLTVELVRGTPPSEGDDAG